MVSQPSTHLLPSGEGVGKAGYAWRIGSHVLQYPYVVTIWAWGKTTRRMRIVLGFILFM
jgi:hypothetical protein